METNPVGWVQGALAYYVGGVQGEYQKITWPPQEEAVAGTIGVTAVVAVVTTALGFVDFPAESDNAISAQLVGDREIRKVLKLGYLGWMEDIAGGMAKNWYIVHTYSGQEARAKQSLLERAQTLGFEEKFHEILIPGGERRRDRGGE